MKIVISQPMYFPWVGMFEQVRLSDIFVYYNDVQFSKGSFTNRVQIKADSKEGFKWLTIPLDNLKLGMAINEIRINHKIDWKREHLEILERSYNTTPFFADMMQLVNSLFSLDIDNLSEFTIKSMSLVNDFYGFSNGRVYSKSSELEISGRSSQRVLDIVNHYEADTYITGHGARKYFDHLLFEGKGISVEYMDYNMIEYAQQFGGFTPYVSILDLIANTGKAGLCYINSKTIPWREFILKIS